MLRDFLIGLSLVVGTATGVHAADSVLTGKTLIDGNSVTVGDIFTNAGRHAKFVLAPVPKVGETLTLSKADLQRVAQTFRLEWQEPADEITVSLQHNATAIDATKIAEALNNSSIKKDVSDDASFQVTNVNQPLIFPGLEQPEISVSDAVFDPQSEKFTARVTISREDNVLRELIVKGNATPMIAVPVLRRTVMPNTIIHAEDVTLISVPKKELRSGAFESSEEMIGMTAKRTLPAGQVIAQNDVTPPLLVKRNEMITVFYQNGPVRLTTKARALDNGVKGQTVMLENTASKKPFEAKITGPQQAEVRLNTI